MALTSRTEVWDQRAVSGAVLLALSEEDEDGRSLEIAVTLARQKGVRMAVAGIPLEPHIGITCSPVALPVSYWSLRDENVERMNRTCLEIARRVPGDVPLEYRLRCGRPHRVVETLLRGGEYAVIVLRGDWMSMRPMRRAARRWQERGIEVYAAW